MDDKDFIFNTFIDTMDSAIRMNTIKGTMNFIKHDNHNIPLNIDLDSNELLISLLETGRVFEDDKEKFEILIDLSRLRNLCEKKENGILLTYRRMQDGELKWARLLLFIPKDFSSERPEVLITKRYLTKEEANEQEWANIVAKKTYKAYKVEYKSSVIKTISVLNADRNTRKTDTMSEVDYIHPNDKKLFIRETNAKVLLEYFKNDNDEKVIWYRRRHGISYRWVKLQIYKGTEYSRESPKFIYIIEDADRLVNSLEKNSDYMVADYREELLSEKYYFKSILIAMEYFLKRYLDFYMIDVENDRYIEFKVNRAILEGKAPYVGSYSKMTKAYLNEIEENESSDVHKLYNTPAKIEKLLNDRLSTEFSFIHENGKKMKTILTKIESKDGVPTKVICRTIPVAEGNKIVVTTFGAFDVFTHEGDLINFKKKRSKQVLAYLIDKHGFSVSTKEIVVDVLEKDEDDKNSIKYVSTLVNSAIKDLEAAGYNNIIVKEWNSYRVNEQYIDCDYYHLLDGDTSYLNKYHNEYMKEYSWAETTNAEIMNYSI